MNIGSAKIEVTLSLEDLNTFYELMDTAIMGDLFRDADTISYSYVELERESPAVAGVRGKGAESFGDLLRDKLQELENNHE